MADVEGGIATSGADPETLAIINQAAGNVLVNGQWMNPTAAAAMQAAPEGGVQPVPAPPPQVPLSSIGAVGTNPDGSPMLSNIPPEPVPGANTVGSMAPAPAQPQATSGAASVPIPSNLSFAPPAATAQAQPPAPTAPSSGGGGGPPTSAAAANPVFQQQAADTQDALEEQVAVDRAKAEGQLKVGQGESQAYGDVMAQRQAIYQQEFQQATQALQKSKMVADQFANQKIDPNQYWGNMSTGDHVLSSLSMLLSGFSGAHENLAVKHFDQAVENDISAQRYNIEHGKEASEMYSKLATDFQAAGMTKQHALDATDLAIKNKALADANNKALELGGPQAVATMDLKLAPLKSGVLKDTQDLQKGVFDMAKTRAETTNLYAEAAQKRAEAAQIPLKNQLGAAGRVVQGPDGSVGYAPSPEVVKDFNTEAKPAQDIQQALDSIDQARKSGVWKNQAQLQVLAGNLKEAVAGLGDIKESQRTEEILQAMVGDPAQYFSVRPGSNWAGREQALRQVAGNRLKGAAARHNIQWVKQPASSIAQTPVGAGG